MHSNEPRKAKARGAPASSGSRRSRSVVVLLVMSLLATLSLVGGSSTPAGADTVNTTTALDLTCTATPPVVAPLTVQQALTVDIEHPESIPRNGVETIVITQPPLEVPTDLDGNTVINLNSIVVKFQVDPAFRIEDARAITGTGPGNNASGTISYTPTGEITYSIPGPLLGGQTYQTPRVEVDVRAVGAVNATGSVFFKSFDLVARAQLPLIGANNVPVSCPTPSPNPPLFTMVVAPGGNVLPEPQPVTNSQLIVQNCRENNQTRGFNLGFNQTAFADVPPGTTQDITLTLDAFDWLARSQEQRSANTAVRNWSLQLNGPDPSVFQVNSVSTGGGMTASYNAGTNIITWASSSDFTNGWSPAPLTVNVTAVGAGPYPQQARLQYRQLNFQVIRPLLVIFTSTSTQDCTSHSTVVNSPTRPVNLANFGIAVPPAVNDDVISVANNSFVDIPVLANDDAGSVPFDEDSIIIFDEPNHGTAVAQNDGTVRYTPTLGTLEPQDNFTYVVFDTQGRPSNLGSVTINIIGIFCFGPCSLTQTIIVDVDPDTLSMQQAGGEIILDTVTLNGQPQTTTAAMQEIQVVNERGGTAPWDITGQLTSDFKTDVSAPDCPASNPSTWNWLCVPGDNLGWSPLATVAHQQVPGDVAVAEPGATISSGLRSAAQKLCGAPATESGGTFDCGALVSLDVPASAGAGRYQAILTLTLA